VSDLQFLHAVQNTLLIMLSPEQAAAQKASRNQDRQTALELSKNIPPVIQGSLSAKDDLRNSPNSSTRTSTNSTIASGSTLKSSSSTSSKTRQKG